MAGLPENAKKKRLISAEIRRLRNIYKELEPAKQILASKLIENAAFLSVTLKDLQEQMLDTSKMTETQQNGPQQFFTKQASLVSVYESVLDSYSDLIGKLDKMLPKPKPVVKKTGESNDELEAFINSR